MTHHEHDDVAEPGELPELQNALYAMRSQSVPSGPPGDLVTSTVEALQANNMLVAAISERPPNRREMMFRFAKYGTLGTAASIAIVVAGSMVLSGLSAPSAFAQVIQNVRDATGARYTLTQKLGKRGVNNYGLKSDVSFSGGIIRTEVPGQFVYLANTQTRETLQLVPQQKLAVRGKASGNPLDEPVSIASAMKEMTEDHGELIETITQDDGTKLDVYRVTEMPSFMGAGKVANKDGFKIWVDPTTKLPTRIKIKTTMGPANSLVEMEFTDFEWNSEFPPGYFDMNVPEGYQLQ